MAYQKGLGVSGGIVTLRAAHCYFNEFVLKIAKYAVKNVFSAELFGCLDVIY